MVTVIDFFRNNLLFKHGKEYIVLCLVLVVLGTLFSLAILSIALLLLGFFLWFFRNPSRTRPELQSNVLTSPADGRVVSIESDENKNHVIISIFLSPMDVHVNWSPADVRVVSLAYRRGAHYPAMVKKSSELNESTCLELEHSATGYTVVVRQIAGILARRILCWVSQGQKLSAGTPLGMIKLGSRVELRVPVSTQVLVTPGQYVYGVQTPIARLMTR